MSRKKIIYWVVAVCFLISGCTAGKAKKRELQHEKMERTSAMQMQEYLSGVKNGQIAAVTDWQNSLSAVEKVQQLFLVNIVGNTEFVPVERTGSFYGDPSAGTYMVPGGFLFFSYNIPDTPEKLVKFTDSIFQYSTRHGLIPPFLSIDQEGGTVNRLKKITGPLPSNLRVASCLDAETAYRLYYLQGVQMKALGFHVNLAPVVEISTSANRQFLFDRSYGDYASVMTYGTAAVNGYENSGLGVVLKHFPGNTNTDPHSGLPEIKWTLSELEKDAVIPFLAFAEKQPMGILMSHARTVACDPETPACLSKFWVSDTLRTRAGFHGIIFSDDIFMSALQKNGFSPEKAAVMAIEAGVDCIMLSEKRFAPIARIILDKMKTDVTFSEKVNTAVRRVIDWKIKEGILRLTSDGNGTWRVVTSSFSDDSVRLAAFKDARDENIQLYRKYFTGCGEGK